MDSEKQPSFCHRAGGVAVIAMTIFGLVGLAVLGLVALPLVVVAFPLTIAFVMIALGAGFIAHMLSKRGNRGRGS